jgi:hypothetical protein
LPALLAKLEKTTKDHQEIYAKHADLIDRLEALVTEAEDYE